MASIDDRFVDRHPSLHATFERHAARAGYERDPAADGMPVRRLLVGAAFTHEYAVEGAALCNPSIVAHPVQPGNGDLAFVLERPRHRRGPRVVDRLPNGGDRRHGGDPTRSPGEPSSTGESTPGVHHRSVLHRELAELHDDHENAAYVLDPLPEHFDDTQLLGRIEALRADAAIRRHAATTIAHLEHLVACSYTVGFSADSELSERVLWPHSPTERHGMEDADSSRSPTTAARATARPTRRSTGRTSSRACSPPMTSPPSPCHRWPGRRRGARGSPCSPAGRRPLRGPDPCRSRDELDRLLRRHAVLGLDPRRPTAASCVGGPPARQLRVADRDIRRLARAHARSRPDAHLFDRCDPARPRRTPPRDRRARTALPHAGPGAGGYVPNVVYSCGALRHGDRLVVPYGVGDQTIAIATLSVGELISAMHPIHTKEPR